MNARNRGPNAWNKTRRKTGTNIRSDSPTPAEVKFREAHGKFHQSVQRHVKEYQSSSDEDDAGSGEIIDGILQSYLQTGGEHDGLERTKTFLQTPTCLICISRIKRESEIWDCSECYCVFHLMCIQRWSKDSIYQQKQELEGQIQARRITMTWSCPKCRHDYKFEDIPDQYHCFCKKTVNPKLEPFLAPHTCGEICKKNLKPLCGHECLILCHPGPCPPCPVTVNVTCYCGSQQAVPRRCSNKEWSCGGRCGKLLTCSKHTCSDPCHAGECKPCPKKSLQKCLCKSGQKLQDCATPVWQCDKVCDKLLQCGFHKCSVICHGGECDPCPLSGDRTCPCGKSKYQLPCTEETPNCLDTCDKLLECGFHTCHQRCHKDACGVCLEIVEKLCKCSLHSKAIQCSKSYSCETKCKRMKDCNKHPCNKKCCDGNCPPCEKPCGRTLTCGNHKCSSVCHRGLCYPCNQTETVSCRCGHTTLSVPCGRKQKTKPPKCKRLCSTPPDCHHKAREPHKCHFGDCPPCKQTCNKPLPNCKHLCPVGCHSSVYVEIEAQKPTMPWEQTKPLIEKKALPCPVCIVPVPVTCLGEHETCKWFCSEARPSSCHKPCGRLLDCGNHSCSLSCHFVECAPDDVKAGTNCEVCENPCTKERPEDCQHACPKPCHPGPCPPCKQMVRIRCHCGLNQPYVACSEWIKLERREAIQSCGNQCPKSFDCGHRCRANCHSGPCPNQELCRRKIKLTCKCKRIRKEFSCETVRIGGAKVECDEVCEQMREEEKRQRGYVDEQKRKEEELKNAKELAKYKKMFEGKKKSKERRLLEEDKGENFFMKYWFVMMTVFVGLVGVTFLYWKL